jgi:methyltransferase-like protein/cyclopropane fatty-acyl-phospholipid synthase-like methyltransferase
MPDTTSTTYDTVLYPGFALAQAHPDRLATLATLFGLTPPDVAHCRILELGCGDGMNLISVALGLPQAECLGIDLAAAGVNRGQRVVQELGLKNITLRQHDIMEVGREFGQFDFIIAHGLYSWVPPVVRDKILAICQENLSANGVAYVSYNAYPGSHMRDMVREMMRYHVREFSEPKERVAQARALVKFLAESGTDPDLYRLILQKEFERIAEFRDSTLFHDDLAAYNTPVYFYQFAEHAARYGLQYLAEAQFFDMQAGMFPAHVVETLNQLSDDIIAREQYLDFLKCRRFRQTLLCHKRWKPNYELQPEKVAQFHIAAQIHPETERTDLHKHEVVTFLGPKRSSLKTDNPLLKAALMLLSEAWPQAVHFADLLAKACDMSGQGAVEDGKGESEGSRALGELLLRAYAGGIAEFSLQPPQFVAQPGVRPVASPLVRLQSRESNKVINLRHANVAIEDALGRQLLQLLDGSRDRNALVNDLVASIESGLITIQKEGATVEDINEIRQFITAGLEHSLTGLAKLALLVA